MSLEALSHTTHQAPIASPVMHTLSESVTQPKAQNRPLLLMYHDAEGKQYVMIAGDGNGSWLLPKLDEIPRANLDAHQHMVIPKANLQIIDFGTSKPTIILDKHAVCSWVPMDTAQKILGRQWQEVDSDASAQVKANIKQLADALDSAANKDMTHASSCNGCQSCNTNMPSTTAIASSARHEGFETPTKSMLAMLKPETQIGATH